MILNLQASNNDNAKDDIKKKFAEGQEIGKELNKGNIDNKIEQLKKLKEKYKNEECTIYYSLLLCLLYNAYGEYYPEKTDFFKTDIENLVSYGLKTYEKLLKEDRIVSPYTYEHAYKFYLALKDYDGALGVANNFKKKVMKEQTDLMDKADSLVAKAYIYKKDFDKAEEIITNMPDGFNKKQLQGTLKREKKKTNAPIKDD